jgi:hypothetical protein
MKSFVLGFVVCCLLQFHLFAGESAAITVSSPDAVRILKLESGQPRLYDSNPLRVIGKVATKLDGWQFTSIPQRLVNAYRIHVNRTGVIYAFGGGSSRKPPTREKFLGNESAQWEEEAGAIQGTNIPMCYRRNVVAGETIKLEAFELQLAAESIAFVGNQTAPPPSTLASASGAEPNGPSQIPSEILAQQAPNAMEWTLAPLNEMVPGDIRQNLMLLRENLLDEGAKKPVASAAAYRLGEALCNDLIDTLNERDKALIRAGYTAAQAQANIEVTNQALEARRRFTNWPTYRREKDQREELRKEKESGAALANQRPLLEWADRTAQIRRAVNALYAQYREALRQPPAAR